ncbi:MAG TPA: UDP-N-acetylglucosamine 2-epimerase (non-hydrolyzing) [Longimicrobiales bacterium]|nr:UDP-N-acetylglucosamine 2-epimerase (non-hydrolyzing) [Longimicrobiales bacterium]
MTAAAAPRVLVVVGTRPEGIKLAPVLEALRSRDGEVEVRLALTGQHTDLLDQVLRVFDLPVDHDLGIMKEGQDLYDVAHGCLTGLRELVARVRPAMVLVQGDTASVFFGALVGFFERVRVGHVEAGLRTGDKWRPYPEELLRRMTGVLADVHFAPTPGAREHLLAEGVPAGAIHVTGNTVVDALHRISAVPHEPSNADLRAAVATGRRLVLVTAHRRESFGAPLREAFAALRRIADDHDDVILLYPVHPNPNVRGPAEAALSGHPRITLTQPLDYLDLLWALRHAALAITDSGGIQEEAPSFGTPVIVLRDVTERPEGVTAGVARLVGTDAGRIVDAANEVLADGAAWRSAGNPYGDGRAGERIADVVVSALTGAPRRTEDWSP